MRRAIIAGLAVAVVLLGSTPGLVRSSSADRIAKVAICHKPGSPAEKELSLPERSAASHVRAHGDHYGPCVPPKPAFQADLSGFAEVPSVSTPGKGRFRARLDRERQEIVYRLRWVDLEGEILFAHIHFAGPGVNGGVVAWLCAAPGVGDAPEGTPTCEGSAGAVEGMLTADDVVGPEAQGIEPGEAGEAFRALGEGLLYVNVHSERFPGGEVRGQIGAWRSAPRDADWKDDADWREDSDWIEESDSNSDRGSRWSR